ncbi:MAG: hypothetical protein ACI4RA_04730 [Kiritimatiellia bacterium]
MPTMSRRDRTILAIVGLVLFYGLAAMLFFSGRQAAWEKSRKAYDREAKKLARQKRLIAERPQWVARADEVSLKMPTAEEGESTQTRWQRILERIAAEHNVNILGEQPKTEEDHGGVWEMPIEVRYEASLVRLVEFLYALENVEDAMFDVRDIDISAKNTGYLTGKFTLTCAYMKGSSK